MSTEALRAVHEGRASFEWFEVSSVHGDHSATFFLLADALRVGDVREAFTARAAQEAADLLSALLPTPKLLDLRFAQAPVTAAPKPKYYPGGVGMADRAATEAHSRRVDAEIAGRYGAVQNVGKHWVLDAQITSRDAVLYGWHVPYHQSGAWQGIRVYPAAADASLRVIQPVSNAHDYNHVDYSMTLMLVRGDCVVDGESMATADVLRSAELCGLAVHNALPLAHVRLPGVSPVVDAPGSGPVIVKLRPLLRRGDRGADVETLQKLLLSSGVDLGAFGADGAFGLLTDRAVRAYQRSRGLVVDGIVGRNTWEALESGQAGSAVAVAPPYPPRPSFPSLSTDEQRAAHFGDIQYVPAPTPSNPEGIRITNDWPARNLVQIKIPQLARIPGILHQGRRVGAGPEAGRVSCHRLAAEPLRRLWQAWEDAGQLERVLTWGGLWAPRFVRGSRTTLSNHAFGTAFDVNAPWNALGAEPAGHGEQGSVLDLVPIAHENGFYWGGHFSRKDGMHFELAVVTQ